MVWSELSRVQSEPRRVLMVATTASEGIQASSKSTFCCHKNSDVFDLMQCFLGLVLTDSLLHTLVLNTQFCSAT